MGSLPGYRLVLILETEFTQHFDDKRLNKMACFEYIPHLIGGAP